MRELPLREEGVRNKRLMVKIQFVISEGENILASATHELTQEVHLKDLLEKTLPGLEEAISALLQKVEDVAHIEQS